MLVHPCGRWPPIPAVACTANSFHRQVMDTDGYRNVFTFTSVCYVNLLIVDNNFRWVWFHSHSIVAGGLPLMS